MYILPERVTGGSFQSLQHDSSPCNLIACAALQNASSMGGWSVAESKAPSQQFDATDGACRASEGRTAVFPRTRALKRA